MLHATTSSLILLITYTQLHFSSISRSQPQTVYIQ